MALDVYGLTRHRDALTLNRFLDEYVDREANADRSAEELALEPLDELPAGAKWDYEWEPSLTLSHIVRRGLDYPRRAFTNYFSCLPHYRRVGIERVIVSFTRDDQLVLGMSVSTGNMMDESEWDTAEIQARELLAHIATAYQCHLGLILLETPPPRSEAEFRQPGKNLPVNFSAFFAV